MRAASRKQDRGVGKKFVSHTVVILRDCPLKPFNPIVLDATLRCSFEPELATVSENVPYRSRRIIDTFEYTLVGVKECVGQLEREIRLVGSEALPKRIDSVLEVAGKGKAPTV